MSARVVDASVPVLSAGALVELLLPELSGSFPPWFSSLADEATFPRARAPNSCVCEGGAPAAYRVGVVLGAPRDRALVSSALPRETAGESGWRAWSERSGATALRLLVHEPVDLLIAGLNLPDWDGHDLASAARRLRVARQVVLCADRMAERDLELLHVRRDPESWTAGVHLDHDAPAVLAETMRRAADGATRVSEALRQEWHRRSRADDCYVHRLTPAQTRILAYAGSGLDDKQVADELQLSVHTARVHRKAVMRKLDLHSHAEVVAYAVRRGLVRFVEDRVLRPGFDVERLMAAAGCTPALMRELAGDDLATCIGGAAGDGSLPMRAPRGPTVYPRGHSPRKDGR